MSANSKTILLTGASGGLGSKLAGLLSSDFKLALVSHKNEVAIPESDNCKHYKIDLTLPDSADELVKKVLSDFGKIDVLINNAGISNNAISWKMTNETWNQVMEVNLNAPFRLIRAVLPVMRQMQFGRIINISSVVAHTGFVGASAYASSKAGLEGLTKSLAKELINGNLTVNAIALGYFEEGMIHTVPAELQDKIKNQIPINRFGRVEELEECIRYIISENSSYLSGQTIHLNGALR
jgi:NAD(P)-dependent dehydrogenase (short-subunit alcohol dehydrogenase family)